jgi:hypothetical protein
MGSGPTQSGGGKLTTTDGENKKLSSILPAIIACISSGGRLVYVPAGTEQLWIARFLTHPEVRYAELNRIVSIY